MEEKIIEMIEQVSDYENLRDNLDIDLLANEILDSLGFIQFITALEEKFDIEIQPTQVEPNTWRKISTISELVEKLIEEKIM